MQQIISFSGKALQVLFIILFATMLHGEEEQRAESQRTGISDEGQIKVVHEIVARANKLYQRDNDLTGADSLFRLAFSQAETMFDNKLLLEIYTSYMKCMDQGQFNEKRIELANKAEQLNRIIKDKKLNWEVYYYLSDIYQSAYKYDKALEYSYKAFSVSEYYKDEPLKARSYLSIGASLEKKNQLIEAFRNYLQALNIAERQKDSSLLLSAYHVMSKFYLNNKEYDKSLDYKLKQLTLLRSKIKVDSLAIMWIHFELEEINFSLQNKVNELNIKLLLDFSKKNGERRLWDYTMSLYRSYLINNDQFSKLNECYTKRYPEELSVLKAKDKTMYFRIVALVMEFSGKKDSAFYCFREAVRLIEGNSNKVMKASFYIRYGQFLLRQNHRPEAIVMFEKAFNLATEASYLNYAITSSEALQQAYVESNDYKNAYLYARKKQILTDSVTANSKKDDLLLMEIDNAARQEIEAKAIEREETERRHNIQYTAIIILIGIVFLILVMLGSFMVPKWSIQFLGFISFIFLFEFIVLISDNKIEEITHGEPWKVLGIKIILIGIMMPLHHMIERNVIMYLLNNKLINFSGFSLKKFLNELFFHSVHH